MSVKVFMKCPRCHGKGTIRAYLHVKSGVCFLCRLDKEALVAPGDFMAKVSFDGKVVVLRDRTFIRMSELAKLSRKEKIAQAAKWVASIDDSRGPHGWAFIELAALARAADPTLRGRIVAALRKRVTGKAEESAEVEGLVREFGLAV